MEERRQLERFDLRLPAEIEVVSRGAGLKKEKLSLQTENICSSGAFFNTPNPLPEGTQVKIDMRLNFERLRNIENRRPLVKVKGSVLRLDCNPRGGAVPYVYPALPRSSPLKEPGQAGRWYWRRSRRSYWGGDIIFYFLQQKKSFLCVLCVLCGDIQ